MSQYEKESQPLTLEELAAEKERLNTTITEAETRVKQIEAAETEIYKEQNHQFLLANPDFTTDDIYTQRGGYVDDIPVRARERGKPYYAVNGVGTVIDTNTNEAVLVGFDAWEKTFFGERI